MTINIYFQAKTPLDKEIRITNEYWKFIVTVKHINMDGKEKEVIKTLEHPDFIRKSNKDNRVYLYPIFVRLKPISISVEHHM